jgi:hypothetical protein
MEGYRTISDEDLVIIMLEDLLNIPRSRQNELLSMLNGNLEGRDINSELEQSFPTLLRDNSVNIESAKVIIWMALNLNLRQPELGEIKINWSSGELYDALQGLLNRREEIKSGLIDLKTLRSHILGCTYPMCISEESGLVDTFPTTLQGGRISESEWNRIKPMLILAIDVAERNLQGQVSIES